MGSASEESIYWIVTNRNYAYLTQFQDCRKTDEVKVRLRPTGPQETKHCNSLPFDIFKLFYADCIIYGNATDILQSPSLSFIR
jgi:hypothetical protein